MCKVYSKVIKDEWNNINIRIYRIKKFITYIPIFLFIINNNFNKCI